MTAPIPTTTEWYRSRFERFEKSLNGEASSDLHRLRRAAIARLGELGFPTTREEEWRFTNVTPIARKQFTPAPRPSGPALLSVDIGPHTFGSDDVLRLVFRDGHFDRALSSLKEVPEGVTVMSMSEALRERAEIVLSYLGNHIRIDENVFTALNAAFLLDGAFIHLREGVELDRPIHLLFLATGEEEDQLLTPRNLIVAGAGSKVSIAESYAALREGVYLTSAVTEFIVGDRAVVEHDKLQTESLAAFHVGRTHFQLGAGSTVVSNAVALGGSIVRNDLTAVLGGERAHCALNGLSVSAQEQLIDNHTTIDHATATCTSYELYKAILDGSSRGVFNGKIFVRKDAQKTDAKQTNKTLLLSDDAMMDTKPQLEIFADDVKCTHGATVGQLDEEQVFYLRTRGIELDAARDLLTFAFALDVIERIHVVPLHDRLEGMLRHRLRQGRVSTEPVREKV
jgi:Fe-S cluster assembly protein SufD